MGVQIGLRDIYYAILDTDPIGGAPVYQTPVRIAGAITANVNPNTSSETLYSDDGPSETATTIGAVELEMNVKDLTLEVQAALLGHEYVGGVLKRKSSDIPPWIAVGFRALKSNGSYRYTWLNKGKCQVPEQAHETKGESIAFQTPTINASFVKRDADDEWQRHIDEDDVDYVASMGTNWFTSPTQVADTTPPTVTSVVPADNAINQAVDVDVVITFSEAMALSTLTTANIFLQNVLDNSVVAAALTVNAARTVVTLNPTANLANAADYRLTITTNVKDVAGNSLAAIFNSIFSTIA